MRSTNSAGSPTGARSVAPSSSSDGSATERFSCTVPGNGVGRWNTMPTRRRRCRTSRAATSSPRNRTVPVDGATSRLQRRSNDDLPEPDAPATTTTPSAGSSTVMASRITAPSTSRPTSSKANSGVDTATFSRSDLWHDSFDDHGTTRSRHRPRGGRRARAPRRALVGRRRPRIRPRCRRDARPRARGLGLVGEPELALRGVRHRAPDVGTGPRRRPARRDPPSRVAPPLEVPRAVRRSGAPALPTRQRLRRVPS